MGVSNAVIHQSTLFIQSAVWGFCLAAAYDVLRILRRGIRHKKAAAAAEDILYWLVAAGVIYALLYQYDDGAIRSYTIFGMMGGMAIYSFAVSPWLVSVLGRGLKKIVNSFNRLLKKCMKPFRMNRSRRKERLVTAHGTAKENREENGEKPDEHP